MRTPLLFLISCFACWAQPDMDYLLAIPSTNPTSESWNPTNASGLQIWISASTASGNEGDIINSLVSLAPSFPTRWATNNAGTGPRLTKVFGPGGTNQALFFATNALVVSNALSLNSNIASMSIICVAQVLDNSVGTKMAVDLFRNSSGSAREELFFFSTEQTVIGGRTADTDSEITTFKPTGAPTGTNFIRIIHGDYMHYDSSLYLYQTNILTISTNVWQGDPGTNTSSTASSQAPTIGSSSAVPGASSMFGWIAEVLVYVPAISIAERGSNYTYLQQKYGL